jgi:hypothetical protein
MVNLASPDLPVGVVFTETEIKLLEQLVPVKDNSNRKTLGEFLNRLAKLGG